MKKLNYSIILVLILMLISCSSTFAATKYEGMVAYRDGVLGGDEWHAGMWVAPDILNLLYTNLGTVM